MRGDPLPRVKRPCDECPWRTTAEPGRFTRERWESLSASSYDPELGSPQNGAPLFACHKTDEGRDRTCAGWLAKDGLRHVGIRLALTFGQVPIEACRPGEGWPDLFDTLRDAAEHDLGEPL